MTVAHSGRCKDTCPHRMLKFLKESRALAHPWAAKRPTRGCRQAGLRLFRGAPPPPYRAQPRSLMVGVGSASFVVHFLAAFFWYWRAAPPATNAPREPAPAIVVLEPRLLDTCPAECPAPSLAFCAGPLVDAAVEASRGLREWLPAICFGIVGLVIGRLTATGAPSPLRRPHGSRVREADRARRALD